MSNDDDWPPVNDALGLALSHFRNSLIKFSFKSTAKEKQEEVTTTLKGLGLEIDFWSGSFDSLLGECRGNTKKRKKSVVKLCEQLGKSLQDKHNFAWEYSIYKNLLKCWNETARKPRENLVTALNEYIAHNQELEAEKAIEFTNALTKDFVASCRLREDNFEVKVPNSEEFQIDFFNIPPETPESSSRAYLRGDEPTPWTSQNSAVIRQAEIKKIVASFKEKPICNIILPTGEGKTTLLHQYAHAALIENQRVFWVDDLSCLIKDNFTSFNSPPLVIIDNISLALSDLSWVKSPSGKVLAQILIASNPSKANEIRINKKIPYNFFNAIQIRPPREDKANDYIEKIVQFNAADCDIKTAEREFKKGLSGNGGLWPAMWQATRGLALEDRLRELADSAWQIHPLLFSTLVFLNAQSVFALKDNAFGSLQNNLEKRIVLDVYSKLDEKVFEVSNRDLVRPKLDEIIRLFEGDFLKSGALHNNVTFRHEAISHVLFRNVFGHKFPEPNSGRISRWPFFGAFLSTFNSSSYWRDFVRISSSYRKNFVEVKRSRPDAPLRNELVAYPPSNTFHQIQSLFNSVASNGFYCAIDNFEAAWKFLLYVFFTSSAVDADFTENRTNLDFSSPDMKTNCLYKFAEKKMEQFDSNRNGADSVENKGSFGITKLISEIYASMSKGNLKLYNDDLEVSALDFLKLGDQHKCLSSNSKISLFRELIREKSVDLETISDWWFRRLELQQIVFSGNRPDSAVNIIHKFMSMIFAENPEWQDSRIKQFTSDRFEFNLEYLAKLYIEYSEADNSRIQTINVGHLFAHYQTLSKLRILMEKEGEKYQKFILKVDNLLSKLDLNQKLVHYRETRQINN